MRLVVLAAVGLDATDVFVNPHLPTGIPMGVSGDLVQTLVGIGGVAAVLWRRPRIAALAAACVGTLALLRDRLTGTELLFLVIAVTVGVAIGSRREAGAVLGSTLLAVVAGRLFLDPSTWRMAAWIGLSIAGLAVGLGARLLVTAQRESVARVAALQREVAEAKVRVRAEIAVDVGAVVGDHLAATRRVLDAVVPDAPLPALRRAMDVVQEDTRAALNALRLLLVSLSGDDDGPSPSGGTPSVPLGYEVLERAKALPVRTAAAVAVGLLAVGHAVVSPTDPLVAIADALSFAAVAVCFLWSRAGWTLAVLAGVVVGLSADPLWAAPTAVGVLATFAGWHPTLVRVAAVVLPAVGVVLGAAPGPHAATTLALCAVSVVVGGLLGMWFALHDQFAATVRARSREAARDRRNVVVEERKGAAREMHDVVGHELSLVTLRALEVHDCTEPDRVRAVLTDIAATTVATREALDSFVTTLMSPAQDPVAPGPGFRLVDAASACADELRSFGLRVRLDLDPAMDGVEDATARALGRVLKEGTTNILRHAPRGADCEVMMRIEKDALHLEIVNDVGTRRIDLSLGRGLRGVQERAHLLGGVARVGLWDGRWRLSVRAPIQPMGVRGGD